MNRLMDKEAYLKKYVSYIDSFKSEYQEDYRILEDDYYHRVHYYTSQSTYYRKRRLAEDHFLNYMKRYSKTITSPKENLMTNAIP